MSRRKASPWSDVRVLVQRLANAGWGDLAGPSLRGVRGLLQALTYQVAWKSAHGFTTVPQLSDASGYTQVWVRECLTVLEDLGVIEWRRGGVIAGEPQPSFIRIVKTALTSLIHATEETYRDVVSERARVTRERISSVVRIMGARRHRRRSPHGNQVPTSPTLTGEASGPSPHAAGIPVAADAARSSAGSATSGSGPLPLSPHADPGVVECPHGYNTALRTRSGAPGCPFCRAVAADERHQRAAEDDGQAVVGAVASLAHLDAALTIGRA